MTILLIIIGMSLVTMIPRVIPAFVVEKLQFRPWINRWLSAIPYAALGALIFPGIMTVIPDQPMVGIVGGIVAIVLATFGLNVVLVVIGAIATVFLMTM
ncbi:AzlD domain-containing protein [Oceanobacillus halophilus]|uniref:AzlD domain-containing protein n=1 Tax=Oceanobacillus halophilus TaxID=930130 RepID=A0A494ZX07_9BACI|nr:AzlD domain-containing protein [Oceanobacillus halophilus]RKQ31252.1 AzlD domain-containing protein [Oceanobacillus halophilus]